PDTAEFFLQGKGQAQFPDNRLVPLPDSPEKSLKALLAVFFLQKGLGIAAVQHVRHFGIIRASLPRRGGDYISSVHVLAYDLPHLLELMGVRQRTAAKFYNLYHNLLLLFSFVLSFFILPHFDR